MLIELLSYFCILFTFTLLIYWPFINYFRQTPFISRTKPYVIGLKFGVTGLVLTFSAVHLTNDFMMNIQYIPVLYSGLLGGPFAILISGLIIGIGLFFLPYLAWVPMFLNINFIVLVLILFFVTSKYKMTQKNIFLFFWGCFIETFIALFLGLCFHTKSYEYLLLYGIFTIFSFYFIYFVIRQIKLANDTVQQTTYLKKIDFLTQLPNNKENEKFVKNLMKKKTSFNLLLVDIRDFKMINLRHGFSTGDLVIKQLAQHLMEYANKNGAYVGRLGGEEFLLILKDVPPAIAIVEANNLINMIAQQPFEVSQDLSLHISVTVGISSFPDNGETTLELLENLVMAKQQAKTKLSSYFHINNLK
ncbi:MAG: GGDEF domain-containing protein [Solibacillus sp.]